MVKPFHGKNALQDERFLKKLLTDNTFKEAANAYLEMLAGNNKHPKMVIEQITTNFGSFFIVSLRLWWSHTIKGSEKGYYWPTDYDGPLKELSGTWQHAGYEDDKVEYHNEARLEFTIEGSSYIMANPNPNMVLDAGSLSTFLATLRYKTSQKDATVHTFKRLKPKK